MADSLIDIPDKPAFKAAEVCELAQIPPYVLRSWEKEFPNLGVVPRAGAPRVYRRGDVEQILRIKQLVFSEGLTLAGARRRLEGEPAPDPEPDFPVPEDVKARVSKVKQELKSLLELLGPARGPALPPPPPPSPGTWPPLKTAAPLRREEGAKAASSRPEADAKVAARLRREDDESALPLLDAEAAEAETQTPSPPAGATPGGTKRRRGRRQA